MKLSQISLDNVLDTWVDRLITLKEESDTSQECYLVGLFLEEAEKFWNHLEWLEARGWVSSHEAATTWGEYEARLEEMIAEWEAEDDK